MKTEEQLEEIKQEIRYLLNSYHVLIKTMMENNKGLKKMNDLMFELTEVLKKENK